MRKERKLLDCVGQRFGRLVIIEFYGYTTTTKHKHSRWICQCDCGKLVVVKRSSLTSGNTKSCGCLASELVTIRNRKHLSKDDIVPLTNLYRNYKNGAKQRGLEFSINKTDFSILTKQNCFYCGIPPSQIMKSPFGDEYVYNGIDRLDNSVGYVLDNCVPCCKTCNYAKGKMSYSEFMLWIKRLINKNK